MCGIVGIVAKENHHIYSTDLDLFEELLKADAARGEDSTGVFAVDPAGTVKWLKVAAHPYALLQTTDWQDFRAWCVAHAEQVWGHNRKATSGNITNANAHPFVHKHITLIHNGFVQNHKDFPKSEVDSEALALALADGLTPEDLIKKAEGAYALVWCDSNLGKVYIARNQERPLVKTATTSTMYFASEGLMLGWVLARNNEKFDKLEIVLSDMLHTIDCQTRAIEVAQIPFAFQGKKAGRVHGKTTDVTTSQYEDAALRHSVNKGKKALPATVTPNIGDFIIFRARTIIQSVDDKVCVWGNLNELEVEAKFVDKVAPWLKYQGKELEGTVMAIYYAGGKITVKVKNLREPETIRCLNDINLPLDEWHHIRTKYKCSVCDGAIPMTGAKYTSIKKRNDGYRIICPSCIVTNFKKMPEAKQKMIVDANGYSPMTWEILQAHGVESVQ